MSLDPVADLARRINSVDSPRGVAYVVGGGTEVFPMLLARGGGSATLLSARIPYVMEDFRAVVGTEPGKFVDVRAARALAMAAFRHALTIRGELRPDQVFGLGSTSKLAQGEGERPGRTHEIHAALQTESSTSVWSVVLPHGGDRFSEERINALLLLNLLAIVKGVEGPVPLEHEGLSIALESLAPQKADCHECRNPSLSELLTGRCPWVVFDLPSMSAGQDVESPRLLLPGSFRPIHAGHLAMAESASKLSGLTCGFEISLFHPEKPPIDYLSIRSRLKGFEVATGQLYLTNAPTYIEKARLFPNCMFVVGHDTALRILDPRFYGGTSARDEMLEELESLGTRFLIFGRVDSSGRFRDFTEEQFEHPISGFLDRSATPVPGHLFRLDMSSTELRLRSPGEFE